MDTAVQSAFVVVIAWAFGLLAKYLPFPLDPMVINSVAAALVANLPGAFRVAPPSEGLRRILRHMGIEVDLLSGAEEARLIARVHPGRQGSIQVVALHDHVGRDGVGDVDGHLRRQSTRSGCRGAPVDATGDL